ncbi:MAG: hypothetical protein EXS13_14880 [Planctomycetes bacterium]|nr:hypothetical protein [Planctomycetota bacterium]
MDATHRIHRSRIGGRIALLLGGLALALAAGEIVVRLFRLDGHAPPDLRNASGDRLADLSEVAKFFAGTGVARGSSITQLQANIELYGWYDRPTWSYFDANGCVTYRTNSLGFRDHEFPLVRPAGELRVLAVGDSFTFGLGVQDESTWVNGLEAWLRSRDTRAVEVINGGYGRGYMPSLYVDWIDEYAAKLDVDAVLIGICLNDICKEIPLFAPPIARPAPLFGGISRLAVVAQQALVARATRDAKPSKPVKADRYLAAHADEWKMLTDALVAIRDSCAKQRIRLVVVVFPMLSQLQLGYLLGQLHLAVTDFCGRSGIESIDVLPRFLGRDETTLWAHPTDQHMNDVGHALIVDGLVGHFTKHPIVSRPR